MTFRGAGRVRWSVMYLAGLIHSKQPAWLRPPAEAVGGLFHFFRVKQAPPLAPCEAVWPNGKGLGWSAEGPRFDSVSALLSLQKLWSVDTAL